jgi:hypothetical protein
VRLATGDHGPEGEALALDLKRLRKLTRVAPLGAAILHLTEGMFAVSKGDTRKALRKFASAVQAARAAEQPFELGCAHLELAQLSNGSERVQHIREAVEVFERFNMPLELARAQAMLEP